tara:strand:+ start:845 stop:1165 length:321 start_codon:yes stop_codon:yes gene_type:complete
MDFDLDRMPKQKQKAGVETGGIPPLPVKKCKPNPSQKKQEASVETGGIPPLTDEARREFWMKQPACARLWPEGDDRWEAFYQWKNKNSHKEMWKEKFSSPPPPKGD